METGLVITHHRISEIIAKLQQQYKPAAADNSRNERLCLQVANEIWPCATHYAKGGLATALGQTFSESDLRKMLNDLELKF